MGQDQTAEGPAQEKGTRQQCFKHSSNTQGGFEQAGTSNKSLVKKVFLFNSLKKITADGEELWQ